VIVFRAKKNYLYRLYTYFFKHLEDSFIKKIFETKTGFSFSI